MPQQHLSQQPKLGSLVSSLDGQSHQARVNLHSKIIVMGSAKVGKTAIVEQFIYEKFPIIHFATVEQLYRTEYELRSLGTLTLDILDTSGSYQFPAMRNLAIKSGDAFVLVFSLDDPESFEEVRLLRELIIQIKSQEQGIHQPAIVIVGNKSDLLKEHQTNSQDEDQQSGCFKSQNSFRVFKGQNSFRSHKSFKGQKKGSFKDQNGVNGVKNDVNQNYRCGHDNGTCNGQNLITRQNSNGYNVNGQINAQTEPDSQLNGQTKLTSTKLNGQTKLTPTKLNGHAIGQAGPNGNSNELNSIKEMNEVTSEGELRGRNLIRKEVIETVVCLDWENGYVECSAKDNVNVVKIFQELMIQAKVPYDVGPVIASRKTRRSSLPESPMSPVYKDGKMPKRNSCAVS